MTINKGIHWCVSAQRIARAVKFWQCEVPRGEYELRDVMEHWFHEAYNTHTSNRKHYGKGPDPIDTAREQWEAAWREVLPETAL